MKKLLLTIVFLSTLVGCKSEKKEKKEIDTFELSSYFKDSNLPAVVMGSVNKDGLMEWHSFGPAVWGESDSISENNIFRIFSMTKAIASVAALQLFENGQLELDEPLNDLMPQMTSIPILSEDGSLNKSDAPITLRHLLTHTSGFGYAFLSERLQKFDNENWAYEDLPRLFEPGTRWQYGTSTDWVGKIVEKVSGQDLETYIRENISDPLGMDRTWFNVPENLKGEIVSWGSRDSVGFKENERIPKMVNTFSAGGGLYSSPKDYLTFLKCLLNDGKYNNGQILKPETVAMLFSNQLPSGMRMDHNLPDAGLPDNVGRFPDETDAFGLAWALEYSEDETIRSQGAAYWAGIANSYYTIDKSKGIAIVYFTQFVPFNDKESHGFYRLYEKEVYTDLE